MRSLPRLLALLVVAVLALAGCGVRPETPAPTEPSPDATERVRARTVEDALTLADDADALAATGVDGTLAAVLTEIARVGAAHAAALGGRYDSGLPEPTSSPTATATSAATPPTGAELLVTLAAATRAAAADADRVDDGALARLLASVATSRGELTVRLAAAVSSPVPDTTPTAADATTNSPPAGPEDTSATSGDGSATGGSTTADDPAAAEASSGPSTGDASSTSSPTADVGPPMVTAVALALAHDQTAYALEVVAAQQSGDLRTRAVTAAAQHRTQSQEWAVRGGVAGTDADPRRVAYSLPAGLDDAATASSLVASLETTLADTYATAVAQVAAGARSELVVSLRTATAAASSWGAPAPTFPGLSEQTEA